MALPSFLKRIDRTPAAALADALGEESGPTQQARVRARRRLIGAVVLLAAGVLVFPAVFETRPRPLPADLPIEMPAGQGASARSPALPQHAPTVTALPPVTVPAPPAPAASAGSAVTAQAPLPRASAAASAPVPEPVAKTEMGQARAPDKVPDKPADKAKDTAADKATDKATDKAAAAAPRAEPPPDTRRAHEAERVRDLLGDKPAASASGPSGRFIVQVGAFRDEAVLRDVRSKVEKLDLRTYTQVIETEAGRRTRLRVGPFTSRQEADSAGAKLKAAGLPGHVLSL